MSECDSELIAVYLAEKMRDGASLEEGMKESLTGLDGVFTYFVATKDSLGMAKDTMAAAIVSFAIPKESFVATK